MHIMNPAPRIERFTGSLAERVLTAEDVAARLGMSRVNAIGHLARGAIPSVKLGNRYFAFERIFKERTAPLVPGQSPIGALRARRVAEGRKMRLETLRRRRER